MAAIFSPVLGKEVGEGGVAVGLVVGAVAFGLQVEEQALGEVFFVFDEDDQGAVASVMDRFRVCCSRLFVTLMVTYWLVLQQWLEQVVEAVPGDLDADAEQNKGNDAKDSVGGGGEMERAIFGA